LVGGAAEDAAATGGEAGHKAEDGDVFGDLAAGAVEDLLPG